MATYTNKNGTASADVLTYNKAGTYHAGAGNDTIKITGGSGVVIYTDSGNNIINVTSGSNHTVKVAAVDADSDKQNGVEELTINGANEVDGYLGSGKDEITLANTDGRRSTGALAAIHGGGWTDTFTINSGAQRYQLYGDAGDDFFYINNGSNIVCWGGAANDTFNVTGGTGIKLRGGDSADIYNISAAGVDMQLGYGNDVVNVTAGNKQTIKGNLGINTINLKGGSDHVITSDIDQAASKKVGHDVGYGVDKVNITGTATKVTANLGDGKDEVTVSAGSGHKIYTEGWGDTLTVSGNTNNSSFDTGEGDDVINISGTGSYNIYCAKGGNDKVTVSGGYGTYIDLGLGNDKITVSAGSVSTLYTTGGDNNIYVNGTGEIDNLYLGSGRETVKVEGGVINNIHNEQKGILDLTITGGTVGGIGCSSKDDFVAVKGGTLGKIDTGAGDDYIELSGGKITDKKIHAGLGKDIFIVAALPGYELYGDDGDDKFLINTTDENGPESIFNGGNGDDLFLIAGRNNTVWAGAGNDGIFLGESRSVALMLENGDDVVVCDEDISVYSGRISGDNGEDNIELKGYLEQFSVHGGADTDTIFVGHETKIGKNNSVHGDAGNDKLTCTNNKYAIVTGGEGGDTITCSNITYGVIYGDVQASSGQTGYSSSYGSDTIYLTNVKQSFINGASSNPKLPSTSDKNYIAISGGCNKDIIFGGLGNTTFSVNGSLTNSLFMSGGGSDKINISNSTCQYNKLYSGAGDDVITVTAGKNNTLVANDGNNIFDISGGQYNSFQGGKGQDIFTVTSAIQTDCKLVGSRQRDIYNIHASAKVLIDLREAYIYVDQVNIYGANRDYTKLDIKWDLTNHIVKIENILVRTSDSTAADYFFGSSSASQMGDKVKFGYSSGYYKIPETNLLTEWNTRAANIGENGNAVSVSELENDLCGQLGYFVKTDLDNIYASYGK